MSGIIIDNVTEDLKILRVNDTRTRFFEALWEIPEGITYNAYLLDTGEGYILFDGWKEIYASELLRILESEIEPRDLKYIVVHHMEPDHSGSLPLIARWARNATIIGHPMVRRLLSPSRVENPFKPVKDEEQLLLGRYTLEFHYAPWIHWPETIFTFIREKKALLTCDAFGSYGVTPAVRDVECKDMERYLYWTKKYLVTVVGNYRKFILKSLEKLESKGLKPEMILPGHGLIWTGEPEKIIDFYRRTALAEPVKGKVTIIYASMYGNTEKVVSGLAYNLQRRGYRVVLHGFTDTGKPSIGDILADVIDSELIVYAAPTYEATLFPPMRNLAELICEKASSPKKVLVVASYAWGGVAGKRITGILGSCGFKIIDVNEEQRLNITAPTAEKAVESLTNTALKALEGEG